MTGAVDIGREACGDAIQELAALAISLGGAPAIETAQLQIEALRAALDAAERERDALSKHSDDQYDEISSLEEQVEELVKERDAADATGYARGVRDAASKVDERARILVIEGFRNDDLAVRVLREEAAAILALLPEKKEKNL